jgi:5-hydroxyisourate hydrolase
MTRSSTSAAGEAPDTPAPATLSTHVLDAGTGRPAPGVPLRLDRRADDVWEPVGRGATDDDGRCRSLAPEGLQPGVWRLTFDTGSYFTATGVRGFYPEVSVAFEVTEPGHHHIPLLLSPFAYSTYRGS